MPNSLVSIITPTYNCARFIAETIQSVQAQSYTNWEMIISDDCSTDNTREVIAPYLASDSRIKYICNEKNSGAAITRNNALKVAQGRWIAFLDSDDLWLPEKLEKQIKFMQNNDCAFSYTSYMTCREDGEIKGIVVAPRKIAFSSNKRDNKIGCLTAIYDTEKVGKVYLPLIRKRQDWGLMMRILQKCKVAYGMKEPLALYRLREGSISSNKMDLIKYNVGVYVETLGWSRLRAFLFFLFAFIPSHITKKLFVNLYNK